MKVNVVILTALFSVGLPHAHAQDVISVYPGAAPGSEKWTHEEKEYFSPLFNTQVVTNVVKPTLTKFAPTAESSNGTAVVICPGGGFHALSINSEGVDVAKWLNEKGVTGFVLKYRLVPTGKDGVVEMLGKGREKVEEDMRSVFELAAADGAAAVKYVRDHAEELGVNPKRVGLMGFSAGGSVTTAVALHYSPRRAPISSRRSTPIWASSAKRRCPPMRRRSLHWPRRTIRSGWPTTAWICTASGWPRKSRPSCTCTPKAGMASA